jgi:ATP-binding cassette subfamily E protein 1
MKRIAVIDKEVCINGRGCPFICGNVCPINRMGKDCIVINPGDKKPVISEELCIGCGICPKRCPVSCIIIINLEKELKQPIHSFGQNAFRLYGLPLPRQGKIIGLIGQNGIGKSTALKILAGQLTPNLGDYSSEASMKRVLESFKGKEAFAFFEKLSQGKLKLSYKPQQIDSLPKMAKGKVRDLLKKVDERNAFDEVIRDFELEKILDAELKELSGGELQRVAISATILKQADVYALDEPSSHLDVRQRLNMAYALQKLVNKEKSVIVIEHDLAVLDYLSDFIHLLFGAPTAYGVVSNVKSTRNGINEYLEGFIKDENLRLREKPIKFEVRPPGTIKKARESLEYGSLEKGFERFSLKADKGFLNKKEVIGVLGPNAIGKTTFVKLLAGIDKPSKGEVDWKLKIAFKPQYLVPEPGLTVEQFFQDKKLDFELLHGEVDRKLGIKPLNDRMLEELSGGELQRVAIAFALSQESDVLLFDEPSAYLDVEQRLAVADLIKSVTNFKEKMALVVDHDIIFIDFVADRLIVFDGIPSIEGHALAPASKEEGMNHFLKELNITFRRDPATGRPRANKPDSLLDREQKQEGKYYYS